MKYIDTGESLDIINYSIKTFFIIILSCYIFRKIIRMNREKNYIVNIATIATTSILSYKIGISIRILSFYNISVNINDTTK